MNHPPTTRPSAKLQEEAGSPAQHREAETKQKGPQAVVFLLISGHGRELERTHKHGDLDTRHSGAGGDAGLAGS